LQAECDIGFLVARRDDHGQLRRLLAGWWRRGHEPRQQPARLTARNISHARIASHTEEIASSMASHRSLSPAGNSPAADPPTVGMWQSSVAEILAAQQMPHFVGTTSE